MGVTPRTPRHHPAQGVLAPCGASRLAMVPEAAQAASSAAIAWKGSKDRPKDGSTRRPTTSGSTAARCGRRCRGQPSADVTETARLCGWGGVNSLGAITGGYQRIAKTGPAPLLAETWNQPRAPSWPGHACSADEGGSRCKRWLLNRPCRPRSARQAASAAGATGPSRRLLGRPHAPHRQLETRGAGLGSARRAGDRGRALKNG